LYEPAGCHVNCRKGTIGINPLASSRICVFNPDTSWCWFQDERAIIDNGQLLWAGVSSQGDVTVTAYQLTTGETAVYVLHARLQANDHAVPALMVLPDGRYLASYSKHGSDPFTRWRSSERPGDVSR
jgi:WD40 repeat protein